MSSSTVERKEKIPVSTILKVLIAPALLFVIDSPIGDKYLFNYGQTIAVVLATLGFIFYYNKSPKRIKKFMLIGTIVGFSGEYIFSILLGMYHYRFDNIPLWLFVGHSLIFVVVLKLIRNPYVSLYEIVITKWLFYFALVYSFICLFWKNDWFGFLSSIVFFIILFYAKKSRLFILIMFSIVVYLEEVGTLTGTWSWPKVAFGVFEWIPSGNPPVGIVIFYLLFTVTVLGIYLNVLHPKVRDRYNRLKV